MLASRRWLMALVPFLVALLLAASPRSPGSIPYLDLAPDGRYLGAVSRDGGLRVWDLASREVVFQPIQHRRRQSFGSGWQIRFVLFQGTQRRALWDCGYGRICWHDLGTGDDGVLLEFDPQDTAIHGISSADGQRMVFGTSSGHIFGYDATTGRQFTYKPKDAWSVGGGIPVYTLEGNRTLDEFLSATLLAYNRIPVEDCREDGSGLWAVNEQTALTEPCFRGVTLWQYTDGRPRLVPGFSDRVTADFSVAGGSYIVHQEGALSYGLFRAGNVEWVREISKRYVASGDGTRFLDVEGRYVAYAGHGSRRLEVTRIEVGDLEPSTWALRLRHKTARGRRVLAALPEKGWVFVGLASGGVDWYQFTPGDPPTLRHLAELD